MLALTSVMTMFCELKKQQESPLSINHHSHLNDLGLWRSFSTHVDRYEKTELDTLFLSIHEAYRNIDASTLDKVWKTKYVIVQKVIDAGGEAIEIGHY